MICTNPAMPPPLTYGRHHIALLTAAAQAPSDPGTKAWSATSGQSRWRGGARRGEARRGAARRGAARRGEARRGAAGRRVVQQLGTSGWEEVVADDDDRHARHASGGRGASM